MRFSGTLHRLENKMAAQTLAAFSVAAQTTPHHTHHSQLTSTSKHYKDYLAFSLPLIILHPTTLSFGVVDTFSHGIETTNTHPYNPSYRDRRAF